MRPAPGLAIEEQPDSILLRMCLWAEARGERDHDRDLDARGMAAVGCVILNRAKKWANPIRNVILARKQFSAFNPSDPNYAKLLTAWFKDPISWERADAVADVLLLTNFPDITHGSLNYYNPSVVQPTWGRPNWDERAAYGSMIYGIAA